MVVFGRLHHALAFFHGVGQGLFAEDVLSGRRRPNGVRGVRAVGGSDENGLDFGTAQAEVVVGVSIGAGRSELRPEPPGLLLVTAHQGHQLRLLAASKRRQDGPLGNVAQSHDRVPDTLGRRH